MCVLHATRRPNGSSLACSLIHSCNAKATRAHNAPPSPATSPLSICVQFWLIDSRRTHSFCLPLVNTSFRCLPQLWLPLLLLLLLKLPLSQLLLLISQSCQVASSSVAVVASCRCWRNKWHCVCCCCCCNTKISSSATKSPLAACFRFVLRPHQLIV